MSPGVFISHKLNDPSSDQFLAQLRPQLATCDCQVWIDTEIAAGEVWREELSTWMSLCHCAVLLISEAALHSDWIFQEASVLSWREEQDKKFKLFPVVLDALSDAQIAASRLKVVLDILRLQSPGRNADETGRLQATVEAVRQQLRAHQQGDNEYAKTAREIAKLLDGVDSNSLEKAARVLNLNLGCWLPGWDPKFVFALEVLTAGPRQMRDALEKLDLLPVIKGKIGKFALPFWVDVNAAELVWRIARKTSDRPLMLLNVTYPETAQDYVFRARFSPYLSWCCHEFSNVFGEDFEGELWDEICGCICLSMGEDIQRLRQQNRLRKKVENLTKDPSQNARQFVAITITETRAITKKEHWARFENLRKEHGDVIYLLLTGPKLPPRAEYEGTTVQVVKPEVAADLEDVIDGLRSKFQLDSKVS
jgi:TIR domain